MYLNETDEVQDLLLVIDSREPDGQPIWFDVDKRPLGSVIDVPDTCADATNQRPWVRADTICERPVSPTMSRPSGPAVRRQRLPAVGRRHCAGGRSRWANDGGLEQRIPLGRRIVRRGRQDLRHGDPQGGRTRCSTPIGVRPTGGFT